MLSFPSPSELRAPATGAARAVASQADGSPRRLPVSVIMERRQVPHNRWISESWRAVGVTVSGADAPPMAGPVVILEQATAVQYLWPGRSVELHVAEVESYYVNLMAPNPGCYLVTRPGPDGMPEPVIVSLSFDAGAIYLAGEHNVYSVPLPPELYRAAEAFVLANYRPRPRTMRERMEWRVGGRGRH